MKREIKFGKMLDLFRQEKNMTMEELGAYLGRNKSTVSRWISGERYPKIEEVEQIVSFFDTDVETLLFGADKIDAKNSILSLINETSSQLTPFRQQRVYDFAKNELTEQNKSNIIQGSFGKAVDEDEKQEVSYVGLLSAGHGCPNYDKERPLGTVTMRKSQIPSHYDLAFMVNGNSMHPTFENGEIVFIKLTPHVMNGQIGAVEINGEAFLKKMYVENRRLRLVSLNCECDENGNRLYPDFYSDEYDDLYVIGRVIV